VCDVSVTMPACEPVSEIARCPRSLIAIAHSAQEIRSPVESSMSISRASGVADTSSAQEISSSVVFPRAESTATTFWPCSRARTMRRAARLIRSASATDVPPNFITTVPDTASECRELGVQLGEAGCSFVDHVVALAEREADQRAARFLVVVEDHVGNGDDARALRQREAEGVPVLLP